MELFRGWLDFPVVLLSRLRPYVPALAYLALTALVGLAAMNNQNNLLFWIFGVLVAAAVLSLVISTAIIRAASLRRLDPHFGAVGEPLIIRYAVENRSSWLSVFNLKIEEQSRRANDWPRLMAPAGAWIMHAGPRETVHGEAVFWPQARGAAFFDRMRVHTTFPFGVIRRTRVVSQPQRTLIYPMIYELRAGLLTSIAPQGLMGSRVTHHAGAGDDYFGLREYRSGDSMRHISWKRTARIDELVTIERASPAPAKVRVVLDLTTPGPSLPAARDDQLAGRQMEERAISLAASLVHAADLAGFEVGLTVLGLGATPILVRGGQWHVHKIMAALAEIDLDRARAAVLLPVREAERVALIVVAPDRIQPLPGRHDATYLSASQLESLAVRPVGWQAAGNRSEVLHAASHSGDHRFSKREKVV